jgi:hypothetical protein
MRLSFAIASAMLLAACGQSNQQQLQDAANQSDPAAAAVLNNAAEAGADPQQALEQAGQATATTGATTAANDGQVVQAKPNRVGDPNRPRSGEPPAKVAVNSQ